ncbi:matrix Gla protein [Lacerta agilis]|nr:matrix Gla protein [Podarcis muralis]XP_028603215.1 matrix Gla protein [Podarcis muralis]XP_033018748.1 matrix Gla protein [Lacerta agilis]XP_033018749.1 matrix Gla protein [Lacerta agilis]XP_034984428.1 matrix Gla protein [Zootoca vivipara]XP_053263295.1 matrix Gla protein [Podarcis raffonei]XP_060135719.1 matrix Gla protein [Zootoca vivipara]
MRSLIILALLAVLMMAAFCYESHESIESHEFTSPFINRRHANIFMRTPPENRRNQVVQERIRERNKTPQEQQREICEDYNPCERYAMRYGYASAYRRFFGHRRGK